MATESNHLVRSIIDNTGINLLDWGQFQKISLMCTIWACEKATYTPGPQKIMLYLVLSQYYVTVRVCMCSFLWGSTEGFLWSVD